MTEAIVGDLSTFTLAELRAAGVNRVGFLRPLVPEAEQGDVDDRDVLEGLAERGLVVRSDGRWHPAGVLAVVVGAAAAAGSVVSSTGPAGEGRLLLGGLGDTDHVLDLAPCAAGRIARIVEVSEAGEVLVGLLDLGDCPSEADDVDAVGPGDQAWDEVGERLATLPVSHRVEAAAWASPGGGHLQQRLTVTRVEEGRPWLMLGRRSGDGVTVAAAPAGRVRLARVLRELLGGLPAQL